MDSAFLPWNVRPMFDLADLRAFARIAGVGRMPELHAADVVADGTLIRLFPAYRGDAVDVHALYPIHRSLSAKVRVFIDALAEHLNRTAAGRPLPDNQPAAAR